MEPWPSLFRLSLLGTAQQPTSACTLTDVQVYLGSWHETTVAIKILLGGSAINNQREAEEALQASQKVGPALSCELLGFAHTACANGRRACPQRAWLPQPSGCPLHLVH